MTRVSFDKTRHLVKVNKYALLRNFVVSKANPDFQKQVFRVEGHMSQYQTSRVIAWRIKITIVSDWVLLGHLMLYGCRGT